MVLSTPILSFKRILNLSQVKQPLFFGENLTLVLLDNLGFSLTFDFSKRGHVGKEVTRNVQYVAECLSG